MDEDKLIASMIVDDFTPLSNALKQEEPEENEDKISGKRRFFNAKERGK